MKALSYLQVVGPPVGATDAAPKSYPDGLDAQAVHLGNNETITGTKLFQATPQIANAPVFAVDAANKAYVDLAGRYASAMKFGVD